MRKLSPIVRVAIIVWVVFVAWCVWSGIAVRGVPEPAYTVVGQTDGYEIREYPEYLVAQVSMQGTWPNAREEGRRILSDFIAGNNTRAASPEHERIAFAVPDITQEKGDGFLISYIMPAAYTLESLPRPNNPEVRIIRVPPSVVAVRSFSGWVDAERANDEERMLRGLLAGGERAILPSARLVQYNPPFTLPFLRRNEVMIPVQAWR